MITLSPVSWYVRLYGWPNHSFIVPKVEIRNQDIKYTGAVRGCSYKVNGVGEAIEQL